MSTHTRRRNDNLIGCCRSCGARIRWSRTERGRRLPLDCTPNTTTGTVALDHGTYARVFGPARAAELRNHGHSLYVPHMATCHRDSR